MTAPRTLISIGGQDVQSMGDYVEMLAKNENARRSALGWAPMGKQMHETFKKQAFQLVFRGQFEQANQLKSQEPSILQESK